MAAILMHDKSAPVAVSAAAAHHPRGRQVEDRCRSSSRKPRPRPPNAPSPRRSR